MPAPATQAAAAERGSSDFGFEASAFERGLGGGPTLWIGWRRRALVLAALAGCLGLFGFAHWLAGTPYLDAEWAAGPGGRLVLLGSPLPALQAQRGQALVACGTPAGGVQPVDALLLNHSPRWQVSDAARASQTEQQGRVAAGLAAGPLRLQFEDGSTVDVLPAPRGYAGLGPLFWPLAGLALLLYLFGAVVLLARPQARNLLYLLATLGQAGNLLFIAMEMAPELGLPGAALELDMNLRLALDACTGAAIVHAFALHPRRLPQARLIGLAAWLGAAAAVLLMAVTAPAGLWWWAQGLCLVLGAAALAVIDRSHRLEPNPYAMVMRRFSIAALATLMLVTATAAIADRMPEAAQSIAAAATVAWVLFLASLLLLSPFLSRSRQVLREFALLAGISTVATSVDLLFVAVFSLGPFTSLAVAVFIAMAVYAGARQYILHRMLGSSMLTIERTFEHLYRAARAVQAKPARYPNLLGELLGELFEPLEMRGVDRVPARARVVGGGSTLVVPVRGIDDEATPPQALALRFALRGQRLFTSDDARLADRVVEQLRRAVAYDQAVERGRHEERLRIAQDLHDDIGARLLTLMYQAQTPEMEDYIRHTLQDLKTLTRGLAASEHHLSHAAAEWKADLTQRLTAARVEFGWNFHIDHDRRLSVVQWSALTRVLRELVSNALYHGHASRIDVEFQIEGPLLTLRVADDGGGHDPQAWAHGLGLGGVRKRVKLLGGEVQWRDNRPRGIVCDVRIPEFISAR
jgi:signal transduction histidine kinase